MPPIPVPPPSPPPPPPKKWPIPKFRITIEDLDHEGADIFLNAVQPKVALREATIASFNHLYTTETAPTQLVLRSIILIRFPSVNSLIIFEVLSKSRLSYDQWKVLHTLVVA